MKINSCTSGDNVIFDNFIVVKKKDTYYSIYEYRLNHIRGEELTHGDTLHAACKKAKLLQIGYNTCKNNL